MRYFKEWHSIKSEVYHNNKNCFEGNNIEDQYLEEGRGGKRLCKRCKLLNQKSKQLVLKIWSNVNLNFFRKVK